MGDRDIHISHVAATLRSCNAADGQYAWGDVKQNIDMLADAYEAERDKMERLREAGQKVKVAFDGDLYDSLDYPAMRAIDELCAVLKEIGDNNGT